MEGHFAQSSKNPVDGRSKVPEGSAQEPMNTVVGDRRKIVRGRFAKALGVFQARMGEAWHDVRDDAKVR